MKNVLLTLGIAAVLASCGSSNKSEEKAEQATTAKSEQTAMEEEASSADKNTDVSAVIEAYLSIKDALVNDDQEKAATAGKSLASALGEMNMSQVSEGQKAEANEIIEVAKNHGEHIAESEIDHQREHFEALGKDMKDLIAITGTDRKLYQQYCPMYNDNKGGMWLSDSEEIRNPLFGSKMLKCGKVEEVINL
jgi:hypothetical protein